MSVMGAAIASSLAGSNQAERISVAEREKAERTRTRPASLGRGEDEIELHRVEQAEAMRSLKNNTDEEAQEDRQEHAGYTPDGLMQADGQARSIDVQG